MDLQSCLQPLIIRGVEQKIENFILKVDCTVRVGERVALVGPSGCGKTSLLRIIAGLDPLQKGTLELGSSEFGTLSAEKREVGFIFQDSALFPSLNVLENAVFGLKVRGMQKSERETLGMEWLSKLHMEKFAKSRVTKLSGGEKQRIAFIRALIWRPKVLLLDEPFSALDRQLRGVLCRELVALHELWPAPMILVTHDEMDVEQVANQRLTLEVNQGIHRVHSKAS